MQFTINGQWFEFVCLFVVIVAAVRVFFLFLFFYFVLSLGNGDCSRKSNQIKKNQQRCVNRTLSHCTLFYLLLLLLFYLYIEYIYKHKTINFADLVLAICNRSIHIHTDTDTCIYTSTTLNLEGVRHEPSEIRMRFANSKCIFITHIIKYWLSSKCRPSPLSHQRYSSQPNTIDCWTDQSFIISLTHSHSFILVSVHFVFCFSALTHSLGALFDFN